MEFLTVAGCWGKGRYFPPHSYDLVTKTCKTLYAPDESALEAWREDVKKLLSHFN